MRKVIVLAAVLALAALACNSNESPTVQGPPASNTPAATSNTATFTGKTFSFTLDADNHDVKYSFQPSVIKAEKGSTATITLTNIGSVKHNLTVKSLNIDKDVSPGQTVTVDLPLGSATTVPFYCKYHQTLGMKGMFDLS
jgi:plastocyanin